MALPLDIIAIVVAVVASAVHCYVSRKAGTWFSAFGLLCSGAIAVSAVALLAGMAWPFARAVADIGIMVAGCAAFGSSVWLHFAFGIAGDHDDG